MGRLGLLKLLVVGCFAAGLMGCQSVPSERRVSEASTFDLDTLYAEQSIIGTTPRRPVWSADGEHVLFLWNEDGFSFRDVWHYSVKTGHKQRLTWLAESAEPWSAGISEALWLNADELEIAYVLGGQLFVQSISGDARQVMSERGRIRSLSVSPDGQHLAFVSDGSLWVRAASMSKPAQQLVDRGNPKAYVESYAWTEDSKQLVFKLTDNSPLPTREIHYDAAGELKIDQVMRAFPGDDTALFHAGVVDLSGQNKRFFQRPNDADYIWDYGISSDGKSLFINSSDLLVKTHRVFVYDVVSGDRTLFYQEHDAKHLRPDWQVAWAPEDNGLIIMTDRDGYLHLYHQLTADSAPRALTSGEWEIASFSVDHSNSQIYFTANKSYLSERQLYRVGMAGGTIERVSAADPGTHQMKLSPDSRYASTLFSNDAKPLELQVIDLADITTTQVTNSPSPAFHDITWANISYIEFDSHLDGTRLVGRLSLPADYDASRKYPLIVGSVYSDSVRNQYGGRTSHPTWGLDQYLVAQGYILLNVNVRGSWGQGRIHNQGLRYGYGVIDIEDLHSGVKHLIKKGYVDPDTGGHLGFQLWRPDDHDVFVQKARCLCRGHCRGTGHQCGACLSRSNVGDG